MIGNPNARKAPRAHKIEGKNEHGEGFQTVELDIWDTAGKEEFSSMQDQWICGGRVFLLCFAVDNRRSWDEIELYIARVLRCKRGHDSVHCACTDTDFAIVLV